MKTATLVFLAFLLAPTAAAGRLAGIALPEQVTAGGKTLVLNGLGLREGTVLMLDVYVAGLYLESKTEDPGAILAADRTKQIVMKFVRSVGKETLAQAWTDGFDKNAGEQRGALALGLAKLNAAMTDVKKDDLLKLTYVPETGVTVSIKGKDTAVIPGDDFQRVLFSIWLGANPPNVSLREGLLGRAPEN